MINPKNITNYNRSESELEEFILFAVLVAGKNSKTQSEKLNLFLGDNIDSPFDYIEFLIDKNELMEKAVKYKLGQYKRIFRCFTELIKYKNMLSKITKKELMSIYGISSKTANFFLMHSRKGYVGACLDTHILKWLRSLGYNAPKSTPSVKKYDYWEKIFVDECKKIFPNKNLADIDLEIWKQGNEQRAF